MGKPLPAFLDKTPVWDNHVCLPFDRVTEFLPQLERHRASGFDVVSLNIGDSNISLERQMRMAAELRAFIADHSDRYMLALRARDIDEAKRVGKMAVFFDVEGGFAMGDQLSVLRLYADLGVRWMLFVYNTRNRLGSGVHDETDEGLTPLGREVVAELDRLGIIKCCSHTGYRTAREILELSKRPTIFSHSNPRALKDHPRNIPDDLMRLAAKSGGVVCINGVGLFLGDNEARTGSSADHIDYAVNLIGADHVGLGLDYMFDPGELDAALEKNAHIWPAAWGYKAGIKFAAPEQLPELVDILLKRGHKEADVAKILGGNMMRVAREVWP